MCSFFSSVMTRVCAECIILMCSDFIRLISNVRFDNCCGCIDLRTGCLIIGYLSLIGELLSVPLWAFGLLVGGVVSADGEESKEYDDMLVGGVIFALSAIMLVFTLLYIVFTIFLLIGLHKGKRANIKAFLLFAMFFVVLSFVIWVAEFWDPPVDVAFMIGFLSSILVSVYFLLVIRSYYNKIDDQMKPLNEYSA